MKLFQYSTVVKTIAICVALAFSSITVAAETKTAVPVVDKKAKVTKVAPTTVAKKAPSFLFVLQAKQGKIETIDGKTFLVLKKTDVHHVIMFSDRPYRIVKYITGTDLAKDWKEGKDSFEKDPPNAVLSSAGQKAQIVILESIQVKGDEVRFLIHGYSAGWSITEIVVVIDMNKESMLLKKYLRNQQHGPIISGEIEKIINENGVIRKELEGVPLEEH